MGCFVFSVLGITSLYIIVKIMCWKSEKAENSIDLKKKE